VLIHDDAKTLDINAWVTVTNTSGATYKDCTLKVVAGDVNKIDESSNMPRMAKAVVMEMAAARMEDAAGFEERQLSEYHLYALGRPTTLADRQTKQIELFVAEAVPFMPIYEMQSSTDDRPQRRSMHRRRPQSDLGNDGQPLQLVYVVKNEKETPLGIPLPAGKVRFYQTDAVGNDQLIGDTTIDHTPKDEELRLNIAATSDIVGQRTITQRQEPDANTLLEDMQIVVRNHKNIAVPVSIIERLYGDMNWTIENNSQPFTKKDFQTIEFSLTVPANSEAVVTYRAHYERSQW